VGAEDPQLDTFPANILTFWRFILQKSRLQQTTSHKLRWRLWNNLRLIGSLGNVMRIKCKGELVLT